MPSNKIPKHSSNGIVNFAIIFLFLFFFITSAKATKFDLVAFIDPNNLTSIKNFMSGLWPMELSLDFLIDVSRMILETLAISIVGTVIAIILALPFTVGALRLRGEEYSARNCGVVSWLGRWILYYLSRFILNLFRGIPELLWALIFVVAVGLGPFPGVLALAVHSTGILGKLYSEILESVDQQLVETGRASGASELAVLLFVRIPATLPVLVSYSLFRWECNMRAATVLGLVGAGGIGTQLTISMQLFAYNEVATLVAAILILVIIVDLVGQFLRTRILDRSVNCMSERQLQNLEVE
ncbi:ABC transporter permease [Desulfotomaculum defluvii]